jgi:ATP-binding cassette subfamily G (WHITE) protein 2 (PDR)
MLEIVNNGANDEGQDWHSVWKSSDMRKTVEREIDEIHHEKQHEEVAGQDEAGAFDEFAMPFGFQLKEVTVRVFQQYWRMPSYVFAKFGLGIAAGLFIGFTFYSSASSLAGMQNFLFAVFMVTTIFSTIVQQVSYSLSSSLNVSLTLSRFNPYSSLSAPSTKSASALAKPIRGRPSCLLTSSSRSPTRL